MDDAAFDTLTRSFAIPSRRAVFSALGAALFPALVAHDGAEDALAKPKHRRHRGPEAASVRASGKKKKKKKKKKAGGGGQAPPPDAINIYIPPCTGADRRNCNGTGACCPWDRVCCGSTGEQCCPADQECIVNVCVEKCDEGEIRCNGYGQCCASGGDCCRDSCCAINQECIGDVCCKVLHAYCETGVGSDACCPGLECAGNKCCLPYGTSGCTKDSDCCDGIQCMDGTCDAGCHFGATLCANTSDGGTNECLWTAGYNCRAGSGAISGCGYPGASHCCANAAGSPCGFLSDGEPACPPGATVTPAVTCLD